MVERNRSSAWNQQWRQQADIFGCARSSIDEPTTNDIYNTGAVASILQLLKLPDGTVKVLVKLFLIKSCYTQGAFSGEIETIVDMSIPETEQEVLSRSAISQFEGYIELNKKSLEY